MDEKKDKVTYWHQMVTLVGAPLLVIFLAWFAYAFDTVRTDMQVAKADISNLKNQFHEVFGFALKSDKTAAISQQ